MVRSRARANQNPQDPDLTNVVATLQRQLMEQQQETNRLREWIARLDQIPQANVVPPQENPVPPVVPQVQEVHHEIPRNAKVPLLPVGNKRKLCAHLLRLRRMLGIWWMTVQMHRNVATMSWQDFITEFRTMYYNREILAAQQDEFNSFRQGSITVMEAVKKFEQLARLCPEHVPNETEKVRRMIKMFRTDIAK
ncbi:hypothetical protein TIFTF001_044660 [Ficus carica]|uniref:Retrotransposon gag domain-containing protein n=1 Tax=Ficus carica TaxID=3494 RepID=A0AA88CUF1_FICCA|nr:hypothetical protein TIFTF001_044660 [Ficus carica]